MSVATESLEVKLLMPDPMRDQLIAMALIVFALVALVALAVVAEKVKCVPVRSKEVLSV